MAAFNGRVWSRFDHAAEDGHLGHQAGSPVFMDKLVPTGDTRFGDFQLVTKSQHTQAEQFENVVDLGDESRFG